MKESEQLKVTDLRIGDKVELKHSGFEMVVVGVLWDLESPLTEATLYLDFEGNEVGVQEYSLDEVELIGKGGEE